MKRLERLILYSFVMVGLLVTNTAIAAETFQTFTLQPGWNAVFLEVEPTDPSPAVVFSGITDLASVWAWNAGGNAIEYIQNPDTLIPEQQEMLAYLPSNAILSNLFAVNGGKAYLVQLGGSVNVSWTVTGQPHIPDIDWKINSFNLVGFHLAGDHGDPGPFFTNFFSSSPAHADQEIYVLDNASGSWVQIAEPAERMQTGEAFWVYCKGSSEFNGPVYPQLQQSTGLHYQTVLNEQELLIRNDSASEKSITLTPSSTDVPLFYYKFNQSTEENEWVALSPGSPLTYTILGNSYQRFRIGVKRGGLIAGTDYLSNMVITDSEGTRILLPVSVTGISSHGLWTGYATINKVNQPALVTGPEIPRFTGSPFSFRLIIHNDAVNNVRLLQYVIQMWQEGEWIPDPENPGYQIVDPNNKGTFVLLSDDSLTATYQGASLRDGRPVARRVSSAAFAFESPQLMTGSFQQGGTLTATIGPPPDRVHPFRHQYHKDHGSAAAYPVTRSITLTFSDHDADGKPIAGTSSLDWGSTEVSGIYEETINGLLNEETDNSVLHRNTIQTSGTFILRRISNINVLTTN